MSLLDELKRRNVFRVAVAYIIVGWLLLQVSDTLVPALHLPEWFHSAIALLVILGFPIAIIFAWAFEMTPEGVKREREVDRTQSITSETGQKLNFAIIAALAIAVVYFAVDKFAVRDDSGAADEIVATSVHPSIAVLPFVNMSDDASNEFFADGITEELLNLLAKIPQLDVTSRSSAFAFKGKDIDIPDVARKLNVNHILEGSVRKSGVTVRITAQLIDASTDKHMWSETYDRELTDIFAIQDEIAREVVDVLQVTLLGEAPKVQQTNTDAYAMYLEGWHYLDQDRGPDDWATAQALFESALEIDPEYAPAWFGRAWAIREQANFGSFDLDEGTKLANEWTERALELDPSLAAAWAMLAHLKVAYDWDWEGALELSNKALEVGPNNPEALAEAGRIRQTLGRHEEARDLVQRAVLHDPLSQLRIYEAGINALFSGDYAAAEKYFLRNAELHPDSDWASDVVLTKVLMGQVEEALELFESDVSKPFLRSFGGAFVYHAAGRYDEAIAARQWMIDNIGIPLGFQIAYMFAYHGDPDGAFEWLEISYDNHDGGMSYLLIEPRLSSLHDDPRWRPLLEKMNLLEYWDAMPERQ